MDEIIKRLEAATEGSRELDYDIHESIGWQDNDECGWSRGDERTDPSCPAYTTSLDAALTLWGTPDLDGDYPRRGVNLFYAVLPGGKQAWRAIAWQVKNGASNIMWIGE